MRRLAVMGVLSALLVCGASFPFVAHADISQPTADTETTDAFTDSGGWSENLGTGLSGTLSEADFVIDWQSTSGFGDRMGFELDSCTDATYASCSFITADNLSYSASNGVHTIVFNTQTLGFPINLTFTPDKYYRITVQRIFSPGFNTDRTFRVLGSAADTYADGSTSAGGLSDLAFTLVGVSRGSTSGGLSQVVTTGDKPSVLFLPGIEGSELYDGNGNKLWTPDALSNDVPELYMDAQGRSVRDDIYAKEGDLVRSVPSVGNVYGKMMDDLENMRQTGEITDYTAAAYDWRLPIEEILTKGHLIDGRIYYVGPDASTTQPYIISQVKRMAREGGKVTIVAHSNGGLIAKRLIEMLGPEAPEYIDKVILVAAPQVGAPTAIAAALHGTDQAIGPFGIILTQSGARTFASTTPMTYTLLPSAQYFSQVRNPVITFDSALTEWVKKYGASINSKETLDVFLKDSYGRVGTHDRDTNQPVQLDSADVLITQANALHSNLDKWTPPPGVQVIQVAGWGVGTLGTVNYIGNPRGGLEPTFGKVVDGDGVVPIPSALSVSQQQAKDYWVDLNKFNLDHWFSFPRNHSTIFDVDELRTFIANVITNHPIADGDYTYLATIPPSSNKPRLLYSLRSPLTLDFYDSKGHHTGISTTTGQLEEQIPGIYFYQLGDTKYAISNIETPVQIFLNGYATSTFTFSVNNLQGDSVVATTTFSNIPVMPYTRARIYSDFNLEGVQRMEIDENGTGNYQSIFPQVEDSDSSAQIFRLFSPDGLMLGIYLPAIHETYIARTSRGSTTISKEEGKVIPQQLLKGERLEVLY